VKTPQPEAAEHLQDDGGVERRQGQKLSFRSENSIGNDRVGVRIPIPMHLRQFCFQWVTGRFEKGRPFVQPAKRECLFLYFYFMDREFGMIHVKLQTWFPMPIQVYVNGHEWLARKLTSKEGSCTENSKVKSSAT